MLEAARRTLYQIDYNNDEEERVKYDYLVQLCEMMEDEEEIPEQVKIFGHVLRAEQVREGLMSNPSYQWLTNNIPLPAGLR